MVAVLCLGIAVTPAKAVVETDNFSTFFDYSGGAVGGIWDGSYNMPNLAGGSYFSNMTFVDETLTVQDNGSTNMGWEGTRSSAPFLFTNVPAGQDFTATVKITSQTSGQWSAAGLIARAANSPTPPGTAANHTDENFVTSTTFRTDAANPNEGNTLQKKIEAGASERQQLCNQRHGHGAAADSCADGTRWRRR